MFDVPIPGGHRRADHRPQTVRRSRKDVTAKCYGGDITLKAQAHRAPEGGQAAHEVHPGGSRCHRGLRVRPAPRRLSRRCPRPPRSPSVSGSAGTCASPTTRPSRRRPHRPSGSSPSSSATTACGGRPAPPSCSSTGASARSTPTSTGGWSAARAIPSSWSRRWPAGGCHGGARHRGLRALRAGADGAVAGALAAAGIELRLTGSPYARWRPGPCSTSPGSRSRVFTRSPRRWRCAWPCAATRSRRPTCSGSTGSPRPARRQPSSAPAWCCPGGEQAAHDRLDAFLEEAVDAYGDRQGPPRWTAPRACRPT